MSKNNRPSSLGRPIRAFNSRLFQGRDFFRWYLPGLLLPVGFVSYGLWRYITTFELHRSIDTSIQQSQTWFILAAVFLIPILFLMIRHLRRTRETIIIYEGGIRLKDFPGKTRFLPWDQVAGISIYQKGHSLFGWMLRTENFSTIFPSTGAPIHLTDRINDMPGMTGLIKKKINPILLTRYKTRLKSGGRLIFGPVGLENEALLLKEKPIIWAKVEGVEVQKGNLVIKTNKSHWFEVRTHQFPIQSIPNLELFLRLIEEEIHP